MERQIAECTTYKELAQVICDLTLFNCGMLWDDPNSLKRILFNLANDGLNRIDSYELDPDVEED